MNERYIKWYTPWLSREFEMLAFGNRRWTAAGSSFRLLWPVTIENKDFGLVGAQ